MKVFPRSLVLLTVVVCFGIVCSPSSFAGDDWRAIDPAELALKASVVEKDADAEALFWEVRVDDGDVGEVVFSNYIRVKVFTERGKESESQIDLQYSSGSIKDISARTIKPDGSIIEVKKEDVHERTIVKASGLKVKAKSFAMPGVEPGAIIEYRWREVRPGEGVNYVDLQFQRDIPARSVTYLVRPYTGPDAQGLAYREFHMPAGAKFEKAKDGFYRVSLSNVPGYHEEPRMPPEDEVRSWILLFYNRSSLAPDKFWTDLGKRMYEASRDDMKANDDVKRKAAEIIGDATEPEEKLRRIYEFCQTKIRNLSRDRSITAEQRTKLAKDIKSPADTLKREMGRGSNIDNLFAALVNGAGLEAHLALSGNRQHFFLDDSFPNEYFLLRSGSSFVAVKLGETWQYFSPAEAYTPFGMLGWREDGQKALIASKDPMWVNTPISPPGKSLKKSSGKFRLLDDGTLEGDARIEYTGQFAIDKKMDSEDDSVVQREETLRDELKSRISTAEISDIKVENVIDPIRPFTYLFHIRVPGYAQRTGKRLFLQPSFFRHGIGPMFTAAERKQLVYFHYPWSERDEVEIELPEGFVLDNADKPPPFSAGTTSEYKINLGVTADGRKLMLQRDFFFGGGGNILFPGTSYGQLKLLFDNVNKNDEHTITLKQAVSSN